jgi:hypothetical protein
MNNLLQDIDKLIEREIEEKKELEQLLKDKNRSLQSLYRTRAELKDESYNFSSSPRTRSGKSIPDHLEDILRERGPKHVMELKKILYKEKGVDAGKQTISGALIRYTNQGRRFKRSGANVFDILEDKEKNMNDI